MNTTVTKPRGRHFFANPGPTNIPDSVLRAIDRPSIDFHDPDFREVMDACFEGVKRVLGTQHQLFMYTASGHGAWEASLANLLSPGDVILLLESGYFSDEWAKMARALKIEVRMVASDWRHGVDISAVKTALAEDKAHVIKAVCVVHNETATGMFIPLPEVRAALDEAGHPALLLVDTISSLGSIDFRMDEWAIDTVVGGSQKGLMLPTGMSFTAVSPKGMQAHAKATLGRYYFDWSVMSTRNPPSFVGTIPVSFFYGLKESLRLLEDEGLPNVFARHHRLGEAGPAGGAGLGRQPRSPTVLHQPSTLLGLGDGGADAGGARRRGDPTHNAAKIQRVAGWWIGKARRRRVPHRAPRRSQRTDGAWCSIRGRNGAADQ